MREEVGFKDDPRQKRKGLLIDLTAKKYEICRHDQAAVREGHSPRIQGVP